MYRGARHGLDTGNAARSRESVSSLHMSSVNATKKLIHLKPLSSASKLQGPIKVLPSRRPMFSGDEGWEGPQEEAVG